MYKSAVIATVILAAGAAGCGSSSTGSVASAAASGKAHVQALATSPAVLRTEKKISAKAVTCAASKGVTINIVNAGTPQMQVKADHVGGTFMIHPVHSIEGIGLCLGLTHAKVEQLKTFTEQTIKANGLGTGSGTKDFTAILNEIAQLS